MNVTVEVITRGKAFPAGEVEAALRQFWDSEAMEKKDDPLSKTKATIYDLLPALDSLTIVRSFLFLEKILEMEVPEKLVKPGGYKGREEMLKDLLPKLEKLYELRHK